MEPKPTTFTFESWNFDPESHRLTFSYRVGSKYTFVETLDFPRDIPYAIDPLNHTGFREAAEALHLIGGISYYKAFCPPEIQKEGQPLSLAQAQFWNTVYEKGLGEFFYRNSIDHRDFIRFPSEGTKEFEEVAPRNSTSPEDYRGKKILVPLGGGKDSIVTLELLREHGANCTLFRMNPHPIIRELARQASLPLIEVQRTLSPLLFEVNSKVAVPGRS